MRHPSQAGKSSEAIRYPLTNLSGMGGCQNHTITTGTPDKFTQQSLTSFGQRIVRESYSLSPKLKIGSTHFLSFSFSFFNLLSIINSFVFFIIFSPSSYAHGKFSFTCIFPIVGRSCRLFPRNVLFIVELDRISHVLLASYNIERCESLFCGVELLQFVFLQ